MNHAKLSVNVNAIAHLRNRRDLPWPSVVGLSRIALSVVSALVEEGHRHLGHRDGHGQSRSQTDDHAKDKPQDGSTALLVLHISRLTLSA